MDEIKTRLERADALIEEAIATLKKLGHGKKAAELVLASGYKLKDESRKLQQGELLFWALRGYMAHIKRLQARGKGHSAG